VNFVRLFLLLYMSLYPGGTVVLELRGLEAGSKIPVTSYAVTPFSCHSDTASTIGISFALATGIFITMYSAVQRMRRTPRLARRASKKYGKKLSASHAL